MFRIPISAALLVALALPLDARAANVIAFDRDSARPNERVKVTSTLSVPLRLYLVRESVARKVFSRVDPRLNFIGAVKPNRSLTFSMPPLDAGVYKLTVLYGAGLRRTGVRLRLQSTAGCPVTRPNGNRPAQQLPSPRWHGNGFLWAGLEPNGVYAVPRDRVEPDGSIFNKLPWVTPPPWDAPAISGERIDATAKPLNVLGVNIGTSTGGGGPSYRSAVSFPTPGCWRVTARVGDVSLTYVVRVAVLD